MTASNSHALSFWNDVTTRSGEGSVRPGPYHLPLTGEWLQAGSPINYYQCGIDPISTSHIAIVEACVAAYEQTVAPLPCEHWRANGKGGRDRIQDSALARFMRRPNSYQTPNTFASVAVRSLYENGDSHGLAIRNNRWEIEEIHLFDSRQCAAMVTPSGEIFYRLSGNDIVQKALGEQQIIVPQRDVLHLKLGSNNRYPRPLCGQTPLESAYGDLASAALMRAQHEQFLKNRAAPSAILSTPMTLSEEEARNLRDRWNEQSKGMASGGVPILGAGMDVKPWPSSADPKNLLLATMLKLTDEHVALAFRIPLQLLGLSAAPFGSTESLMRFWLSSSLGNLLDLYERELDKLFNLDGYPREYCEFDTSALLRTDDKGRVETLSRGIMSGLYSIDEARNMENLNRVPFGAECRTQAQNVPLSAAAQIPLSASAAPAAPAVSVVPDFKSDDIAAIRKQFADKFK